MSEVVTPVWFAETLRKLTDRQDLSREEMTALMQGLLSGSCGPAETAALLVALRMKGETASEMACAAAVMRQHAQTLDLDGDTLLDTCGTGGDGLGTFNISTATALVVAAAGVRVVKHGNRAVSSTSGSADVLVELGVQTTTDSVVARRCVEEAGMAFCLAPLYHPALKHVGEVRRRLGVRTLFNCLGPLANPAQARYQLLGVGRLEWLDRMAAALAELGTGRAFLVHSQEGLDEVSLSSPTMIREVRGGAVVSGQWLPRDFGLPGCTLAEIRVKSPRESAEVIRAVLEGRSGPARNVVLANAAAALLVVGKVSTLLDGVRCAASAIDSGHALRTLQKLIDLTRTPR